MTPPDEGGDLGPARPHRAKRSGPVRLSQAAGPEAQGLEDELRARSLEGMAGSACPRNLDPGAWAPGTLGPGAWARKRGAESVGAQDLGGGSLGPGAGSPGARKRGAESLGAWKAPGRR
ncbi:hypothetical protein GCM10010435_89120 [Winogradskya consettensis]